MTSTMAITCNGFRRPSGGGTTEPVSAGGKEDEDEAAPLSFSVPLATSTGAINR